MATVMLAAFAELMFISWCDDDDEAAIEGNALLFNLFTLVGVVVVIAASSYIFQALEILFIGNNTLP